MHERLLILYGSQTGQAKAISEQIYQQAINDLEILKDFNISIEHYCLDQYDKKFSFETEKLNVIIVVSTTGDLIFYLMPFIFIMD